MEKLSLIRQLRRWLAVVPVIGPECVLSQQVYGLLADDTNRKRRTIRG
jgi:hypothetical protein